MVIGSSFVLPDKVGPVLHKTMYINEADAVIVAQFACPVLTQFAAAPVQLLALDMYNRPMTHAPLSQMLTDRTKFLMNSYGSVVMARIARIAPGYGIGGIGNTYFRTQWRASLVQHAVRQSKRETNELRDKPTGLMSLFLIGRNTSKVAK